MQHNDTEQNLGKNTSRSTGKARGSPSDIEFAGVVEDREVWWLRRISTALINLSCGRGGPCKLHAVYHRGSVDASYFFPAEKPGVV